MFENIIWILLSIVLEKLMSPLLEKMWGFLFSGNDFVSNWIYSRIAKGSIVNLPFYLLIILGGYFIHCIWINKTTVEKGKDVCDDCHEVKCGDCEEPIISVHTKVIKRRILHKTGNEEKGMRLINIIKSGIVVLLLTLFLTLTNYINHNTIFIQNNIDIVSPYISVQEYNELKSQFYLMNNRQEYDQLIYELNNIAADKGIELQK